MSSRLVETGVPDGGAPWVSRISAITQPRLAGVVLDEVAHMASRNAI